MASFMPAAWSPWAMDQAMERLLATPKTTPLRPDRSADMEAPWKGKGYQVGGEGRRQKSEVKRQKSEVKSQKSKVKRQKSEGRSQKVLCEARAPGFHFYILTSYF